MGGIARKRSTGAGGIYRIPIIMGKVKGVIYMEHIESEAGVDKKKLTP